MQADERRGLEQELKHARAIALASVGEDDHAQNVAYRNEIAAKLAAASDTDS